MQIFNLVFLNDRIFKKHFFLKKIKSTKKERYFKVSVTDVYAKSVCFSNKNRVCLLLTLIMSVTDTNKCLLLTLIKTSVTDDYK